MRRRGIAAAAVAVGAAAAAGGVATGVHFGGTPAKGAGTPQAPRTTGIATVERRDLVDSTQEDGTLGYSGTRDVLGNLSGTITWLPVGGKIVHADHPLYRVDGTPVVLFDGKVPAYRELSSASTDGADIGQLERNLRALGYDPWHAMVVDGSWDSGTTAAVKRWQKAHSLEQTGTVELGRVVFLPGGPRRVGAVSASLGERTGGSGSGDDAAAGGGGGGGATSVLSTTSTTRVVLVDLPTDEQSVARSGAKVTVDLPSGDAVHGRIASVGRVATVDDGGEGDPGGGSGEATIAVTIHLQTKKGLGLDKAPVTVRFERSRRRHVLTVPVTALIARPGGVLAVRVIDGTQRRLVTVTAGQYAGGYVEVHGPGVREGVRVENAEGTA
jgi:peptidoglycan hydrolase-like protein with peptidoglycan-binding domain